MSKDVSEAIDAATAELAGTDPAGGADTGTTAPDTGVTTELPELHADENWSKEAKEAFAELAKLPEHGRRYQETWLNQHKIGEDRYRERQSQYDRLQHEYQQANGWLQQFHNILSPYAGEYQRAGMSPIAGVQRALAWEAYIRENPREALTQLAQQAGVNLAELHEAGQPQYVDPATRALQQQVQAMQGGFQQLSGFIQQQQQQSQYSAFTGAMNEIEAFKTQLDEGGNPKYPFFDDVLGEMKQLIDMGNASGNPITLEQAYSKAIRLSDTAWTKKTEADKRAAEEQAKKDAAARLAEANKANKANGAKSPAGRGGSPSPAKAVTTMDAINQAFAELTR